MQGFLGGLLLSLLLFSFSEATVDWDKELQKLVSDKVKLDVIKYISARDIANAYDAWKAGSWTGKLFKFGIQSALWTGFIYISSELLMQYIDERLQQASQQSQIGYYNGYCWCVSSLSCNSYISDDDDYVAVGFDDAPFTPFYSYVNGISGAPFCYVTYQFWGSSSYTSSTSFYLSDEFYSYVSVHMCPDNVDTSICDESLTVPQTLTALDILEDPSNYVDIANLIDDAPSTASQIEIPDIEAYPLPPHPSDTYTIKNLNGDGTTTVDDGTGLSIEEDTDTTTDTTTDTDNEDYTFIPPSIDISELDTNIDVPEKKSISDLIQNAISSIPALNILKSVRIEGSGSCSFNIPFSLGGASGSGTIDFCQFASVFSIIGGFILSFAHLYAIFIVFKGD